MNAEVVENGYCNPEPPLYNVAISDVDNALVHIQNSSIIPVVQTKPFAAPEISKLPVWKTQEVVFVSIGVEFQFLYSL